MAAKDVSKQLMATASKQGVLITALYPSLFNPANGDFLTEGTMTIYLPDKTTLSPFYQDSALTDPYPNPYEFDIIAAFPPMYADPAIPEYWIEIRPAALAGCPCEEVDPIYTFFLSPNSGGGGSSTSTEITNFIANPTFQHPIPFNKPGETVGNVENVVTQPCQAWFYENDSIPSSSVNITFNSLVESGRVSNPTNEIRVKVTSLGGSMTKNDLWQELGYLNILQGEVVTFSLNGLTNAGSSETLSLIIENFYENSEIIETPVATLTITNVSSTQFVSFTMPNITNEPYDAVLNRTIFRVRFPLLKVIDISVTSFQLERGNIANPVFIEESKSIADAKTFAEDFTFPADSIPQKGYADYNQLEYFNSGFNWYTHNTGTAKPVLATNCPPDMIIADGSVLKPTDYSVSGIPYQRLYDVFGNTFGGTTDIVATSSTNVVTASSSAGGRELTAWTAGTSGFTVTQTVKGLNLGVKFERTADPVTIRATFLDNFAVQENPDTTGNVSPNVIRAYSFSDPSSTNKWESPYTITTIDAGSPSTPAIADITFTAADVSLYKTDVKNDLPGTEFSAFFAYSLLEFSSTTNNGLGGNYWADGDAPTYTRQSPYYSAMCIKVSLDGKINDKLPSTPSDLIGIEQTKIVPFLSSQSLQQNINTFLATVNNPFTYTITIPALPAASSYFLYSSTTIDYCAWFKIDGTGTQPSPPGFGGTYVEIDLLSSDSTAVAASKIAAALDKQNFTLPTQADYVVLGNTALKWAVYL